MRNKRNIGAINSNQGGRTGGRGRGRARNTSGRGQCGGRQQKVIMNGLDVTDVTRNYTSDEWDKLRQVATHMFSGRSGRGKRGGRGGNRDGGRGRYGG
jgi:hypothetical protein